MVMLSSSRRRKPKLHNLTRQTQILRSKNRDSFLCLNFLHSLDP
ncbi:unnamed protein product [Arabidopsis halleri]